MDPDLLANWTTQMRKGLLELCVLASLRGRKLYGYDIVKRLAAGGGLAMGEGTVYPILSRFKKDGLVETTLGRHKGRIPGWRAVGTDELELVNGVGLTVTTYEAE